ncbi:MAG TPA: hypothetical protein VGG44_10075, partial [Tepidisphaeraceae bacterium]
MRSKIGRFFCVCVVAALPACAWAQQINGWVLKPYVFAAFPDSTLAMTTSNANPGTASISDS